MRASSAALVNTRAACARRIPTRCRCRGHRACQHGRGDRCGELPALVVFAGVSGQHAHANVLLTSVTVSARAMTGYRCGKNAGRVDVGDGLLHQGVQLPVPLLSALSHRPMKHGPSQCLAHWAFLTVPALSPAILCAGMLVSSSATSAIVGCVAVDFKTVVHVASAATFALETVLARLALTALKSCKLPVALCVPVCSLGMPVA